MDNTSKADVEYGKQLANPFFNRAQLYAFAVPPSDVVIEEINKGGKNQDYLPIEYIRTLLDRYIGSGRWELQAILHSTDREIVKKFEGRGNDRKQVDRVAATANVNVTLTIHARDGSTQKLTYASVGSNTQYAGLEAGFGSIIGNAIKSAESDGIKRVCQNLGKAFGFDLKRKVKKEELPPNLDTYARMLNERHAGSGQRPESAAATQDEAGATSPEPEAQKVVSKPPQASSPKTEAPKQQERPVEDKAERPAAAAKAADRSDPAPVDNASEVASAEQPAPEAKAAAQPSEEAFVEWEMSMMPTQYNDWLRCIQTISKRFARMTSDTEIQNYIRRNKKVIEALPQLPETAERPAKDFKARFRRIVNAAYERIGIAVPEAYQDQAQPA